MQCLALNGRGDLDSLPAGDVAYLKLVGHLAGLGRRATVAEVEDFYARYAPFRGLAARFTLVGCSRMAAAQPPLDTTRRTPSTRPRSRAAPAVPHTGRTTSAPGYRRRPRAGGSRSFVSRSAAFGRVSTCPAS